MYQWSIGTTSAYETRNQQGGEVEGNRVRGREGGRKERERERTFEGHWRAVELIAPLQSLMEIRGWRREGRRERGRGGCRRPPEGWQGHRAIAKASESWRSGFALLLIEIGALTPVSYFFEFYRVKSTTSFFFGIFI